MKLKIVLKSQNTLFLSKHSSEDIWFITDYSTDGKTRRCDNLEDANKKFFSRSKELLDEKYWNCYK